MIRRFYPENTRQAVGFGLMAVIISAILAVFSGWIIQSIENLGLPRWASLAVPAVCLVILGLGYLNYDVLVLLTFSLIGFVRFEPAPFDVLILLVMVIGLARGQLQLTSVRNNRKPIQYSLYGFVLVNLISMFGVVNHPESWRFLGITLYMVVLFIFVRIYATRPGGLRMIMTGYLASALFNAVPVVLGFFGVNFMTQAVGWSVRGVGFFKDPNVFGPFLAAAALWALDRVSQPAKNTAQRVAWSGLALLFSFTAIYSLSRAVWINLAVSICIFVWFLARRSLQKGFGVLVLTLLFIGIAIAFLEIFQMTGFVEEHLRFQDYDFVRFNVQYTGLLEGLRHPFGIGPTGLPNAHSLYIKTFAEQGWAGLITLGIIIGATLIPLARQAFDKEQIYPVVSAQVLVAILIGQLINSLVIDSIHWRHLWVLLGIAWAFQQEPNAMQEGTNE
jgi:hypothetical protein